MPALQRLPPRYGALALRSKKPQRDGDLARIHILAKELGLSRGDYEAVLWEQARVESSKNLDEHQRRALINHLESLIGRHAKVEGAPPRNMERPQLRKIAALLADLGKSWAYAAGIANKLHGKNQLDWCGDIELRGVITALVLQKQRAQKAKREATAK